MLRPTLTKKIVAEYQRLVDTGPSASWARASIASTTASQRSASG